VTARKRVIEGLSVISLVLTLICLAIEGPTLASIMILSIDVPYLILLFIENRKGIPLATNLENKVEDLIEDILHEESDEIPDNILQFPAQEELQTVGKIPLDQEKVYLEETA